MSDDNFDNYNKTVKTYSDILNRKKTSDKLSYAFSKQADSMRPLNVGQRREQALLRGFAVGLSNDYEREAKLVELEEQCKQMGMLQRELTMAAAQNKMKKEKQMAFFNENQAALSQLSEYIYAGKHNEVDILAPEVLKSYGDITGAKVGKFSHYKNGYATFLDDKGEPRTINIKNLMQPVMDMLPEEQKKNYRGFLSPLQNADIDRAVKEQSLKLEKLQADIDSSKAHSKVYEMQAKELENNITRPPMTESQKILFKANVDNNQEYLKEAAKKVEANKILIDTLNETEQFLIEASKKGQVGSDAKAIANRIWGKYISGDSKAMSIVDMAKAAYFSRMKEAGGSNVSSGEFFTVLETVPNTDKNLAASLNTLNRDRDNALKNILKFNKIEKNLREREYQGSPYDPAIHGFSDEEYSKFRKENNKNKVVVIRTAKLGTPLAEPEVAEISADELENYIADGFEIYYE
ncbi:hypothetical protein Megpolyxen_01917 (plasmid) [Candidatus Megaera polyxenophila]|nr:hypothetical protein Megpolyxen_01917 [Candidatus Megaera polyxenophila]